MHQPVNAKDKGEGKNDEKKEKKEVVYSVEFYNVAPRDMRTYVTSTAALQADRQVDIFPKAAGQIQKLSVEEGQKVHAGDVLVGLDGDDARLQLNQATVNLKRAKSDFERIRATYERKLVSTEEFEAKKFELDRMEAEYNSAKHKLEITQVIAPFDGTIVNRFVELGQTVQPSEKLFTLAALEPLEAEVFLPERKVGDLAAGQDVNFSRDDSFENLFQGRVDRVSPVVDRETGTVKVTLSVPNAPSFARPGTYTHLRIVTATKTAEAVIPKKALVYDSRQLTYVFLTYLDEENAAQTRVKKIVVKTGIEEDGMVEIIDGLNVGDQIVLTGKDSLKDGLLVRDPSLNANASN
nr:efflux RND transporter periplasmic adaptor subunit [Acanthopleuribacter pedis]